MSENITIEATTMPMRLRANICSAPTAIVALNLAIPMPDTASGGTSATAIAVPGRASLSSDLTRAYAVAAPATMAIMR